MKTTYKIPYFCFVIIIFLICNNCNFRNKSNIDDTNQFLQKEGMIAFDTCSIPLFENGNLPDIENFKISFYEIDNDSINQLVHVYCEGIPSYFIFPYVLPGKVEIFDNEKGLWKVTFKDNQNDTAKITIKVSINDSTSYFVKGYQTILKTHPAKILPIKFE